MVEYFERELIGKVEDGAVDSYQSVRQTKDEHAAYLLAFLDSALSRVVNVGQWSMHSSSWRMREEQRGTVQQSCSPHTLQFRHFLYACPTGPVFSL